MEVSTRDPETQVPPDDGVVTEWFAPVYQTVCAVLPPFLKIPPDIRNVDRLSDLEAHTESTRREGWHRVSWQEVQNLVGVNDAYGLLQLLHKRTGPLQTLLTRIGLEEPPEGEFPEILIPDFLGSIRDLGHAEVTVEDEFGSARERFRIEDLLQHRIPFPAFRAATMYVDDRSILYGVNWDSFFVFLCGSRGIVESTIARYRFEGFFFQPGMTSWRWETTSNPAVEPTPKDGAAHRPR